MSVGGDFVGSVNVQRISGPPPSNIFDDDYDVDRTGILVRGKFDGPLTVTREVFTSDLLATSFRGPIDIGWYFKGAMVAAENSPASADPILSATNDPLAGTMYSVRIGFAPPTNGGLIPPDPERPLGLVGIDFGDGVAGAGQVVCNARTIDQWLAAPNQDFQARDGVIRASVSIGAAATATEPVRGVEISRMSRLFSADEIKLIPPRIESPVIYKLHITRFLEGVVWSGIINGLSGIPGSRIPSLDFSVVDDFAVTDIGPGGHAYIKGCRFIDIQKDLNGELFLPKLGQDEQVSIHEKLGVTPCGTDSFYNPIQIWQNEDSPRRIQCASTGAIRIADSGGLKGQIVINAKQIINPPENAWVGRVIVGDATQFPLVFEPGANVEPELRAPYYEQTSAFLGGGAIGLAPFHLYEAECEPRQAVRESAPASLSDAGNAVASADFAIGGGNAFAPVKIRFYGPIEINWNDEQAIECSPFNATTTPTDRVCGTSSAVPWNDIAASLFDVREPASTGFGIESRTLSLARAPLTSGYASIAPGLYRARLGVMARADAVVGQPPCVYWQVCDGSTGNSPATTQSAAYHFRVNGENYCNCHDYPANFNCVVGITVQDIFDYLAAWFASSPTADFNHVNGVTIQDLFDFLAGWFAGC